LAREPAGGAPAILRPYRPARSPRGPWHAGLHPL